MKNKKRMMNSSMKADNYYITVLVEKHAHNGRTTLRAGFYTPYRAAKNYRIFRSLAFCSALKRSLM